ncbi:MlaD family protein [Jatrophihabitans endophyticus]|uniref:MlaD family protein n=1 Tax=Jatrophihabitans endophyticus TaxID=1206085 RepID=UPI001A00B5BA|nr:MlaD family protein [Jatrophihabitans endophyticus]MBE7189719.1 MCE family protein [Jatrophihabitans endophyticus]
MLNRTTRFQVLAFVAIAVLGIAYVGLHYVGIDRWFGAGYTVKVDLQAGGGVFPNADVTYRGVSVGRVGDMRLTKSGVQVDLDIRSGRPIPSDVKAVVADGSVIGEQYVDLRPRTSQGPYLHDGSLIRRHDTALPPPVQRLLKTTVSFSKSVPVGALNTVVNQIYLATDNSAQNLKTLITSSKQFFSAADNALPQTVDLIQSSRTVLGTQQKTSDAIKQFSRNLVVIGRELKSTNGDFGKVLSRAKPALDQTNGLIDDIDSPLHSLLTNLLSTSQIFLENKNGLHEVYSDLPTSVTAAGQVITPEGINTGLVPTFFDPLPCVAGYGGTHVRRGLQTKGDPGLNTSASCAASSGTGEDLHGSQNAP